MVTKVVQMGYDYFQVPAALWFFKMIENTSYSKNKSRLHEIRIIRASTFIF